MSLHGLITTDESWTLFVPYEKHVFVIDFYLLEGRREKERKKKEKRKRERREKKTGIEVRETQRENKRENIHVFLIISSSYALADRKPSNMEQ